MSLDTGHRMISEYSWRARADLNVNICEAGEKKRLDKAGLFGGDIESLVKGSYFRDKKDE